MTKLKIIAEIANAHQGDGNILKTLVKAAAECKADAVKFQWYKFDEIATPDYQWYKDYIDLFIREEVWIEVLQLAESLNLEVWVDVIDKWGLKLLHQLKDKITGVKLPSVIIQSSEMIEGISSLNKPVLVGVGGWFDDELDNYVLLLKEKLNNKMILLSGIQNYPTKAEDANLVRIQYLKDRYNLQAGFADHENADNPLAIDLPVYAYFAGAKVIEKHITIDRKKKGYDYYSALERKEFSLMVSKLRQAEKIMGDGTITTSQRSYLKDSLRIVASNEIQSGEMITTENISYKKCPINSALMPQEAQQLLPAIATEKLIKNQPILLKNIRKPKITIAVICRLKSRRLHQKALLPINGVPSIERCLINCLSVSDVDHVVLATSNLPQDDPLEKFTLDGKIKVVRGDPDNVAKRMADAAELTSADIILRITGDNPAVSPEIVEYLIKDHLKSDAEFTASLPNQCPTGTDANVINVSALLRLLNHSKLLTHTEYLNAYFENNLHIFKVNLVKLPNKFRYPDWRLTLDEKQDLEMFEKIYQNLNINKEPLYFSKLSKFLNDHPEVAQMNAKVIKKWVDDRVIVDEIKKATSLS